MQPLCFKVSDASKNSPVQVTRAPNSWNQVIPVIGGNNGSSAPWGVIDNPSGSGTFITPGTGFLVVYIDNQSIGKNVWFDNLSIGNYQSEVIEETHYQPYGLAIGMTQLPGNIAGQPYKYNGKELEKSFGLEIYDYGARVYDPQVPHWWQIDPLAEVSRRWSPYNYALDNPIVFIDPDGMKWLNANDEKYSQSLTKKLNSRLGEEEKSLSKANENVASIKADIDKNGASDKLSKKLANAQKEVGDITTTISDLTSSINEIAEMGSTSEQTFTFSQIEGSVGGTDKRADGVIEMKVVSEANSVHELAHGYEKWKNTMSTNRQEREINPYRRQYSFDPSSMNSSSAPSDYGTVRSRSDITKYWIMFLHNDKFEYPYMDGNPSRSTVKSVLKIIKESERK